MLIFGCEFHLKYKKMQILEHYAHRLLNVNEMNEWNLNFYSAFTTVLMFESARQKKIVYHTLKWLWNMNVFRLHLKVSKSVSLLREFGKEFQSLGAQIEKALPPNELFR
jgi:hypothetical protein